MGDPLAKLFFVVRFCRTRSVLAKVIFRRALAGRFCCFRFSASVFSFAHSVALDLPGIPLSAGIASNLIWLAVEIGDQQNTCATLIMLVVN
jgi:hypothetical protein